MRDVHLTILFGYSTIALCKLKRSTQTGGPGPCDCDPLIRPILFVHVRYVLAAALVKQMVVHQSAALVMGSPERSGMIQKSQVNRLRGKSAKKPAGAERAAKKDQTGRM